MSGDDGKGYDREMDELIAAGFPVGKGVPDGLNKTADWTSMAGSDSGVPDGLTKTADWTGLDPAFPVGSGVPDGIDKTADWTGISDSSLSSSGVGRSAVAAPPTSPLGMLRAESLAKVIEAARTRKGIDAKVDFDSLPAISPVPTRSGAPTDSNKTQDWTDIPLTAGSGAPAGSNKTQDWTTGDLGGVPSGSGAPTNPNKTQDWTGIPLPGGSGAPADSNKTQDWTQGLVGGAPAGFPTGTGAPPASNKTQDWTSMDQLLGGGDPPKGTMATQDWSFDGDE